MPGESMTVFNLSLDAERGRCLLFDIYRTSSCVTVQFYWLQFGNRSWFKEIRRKNQHGAGCIPDDLVGTRPEMAHRLL